MSMPIQEIRQVARETAAAYLRSHPSLTAQDARNLERQIEAKLVEQWGAERVRALIEDQVGSQLIPVRRTIRHILDGIISSGTS